MKRIITILASVALVASLSVANAQKKDFDPYWFLQIQGGAAETIGETVWTDLISPSGAISLGYQFSPVFAARLNANAWQGKGAINDGQARVYKYNYVEGAIDLMADLAALFGGYKFDRTINPYIFGGVGANYAFNNDETLKTRVLRNGRSADIVYAFDEPTIVNSYGIYNYGDNNPDQRAPKTWTFSGSNDNGETWVPLDSHGDQDPETGWVANEYRFYYFENSTAYTSYKIDISGNNGNQYLQFPRMEFYNVNLADAVPISFGEPSFASDSTSVSVSQPYT